MPVIITLDILQAKRLYNFGKIKLISLSNVIRTEGEYHEHQTADNLVIKLRNSEFLKS